LKHHLYLFQYLAIFAFGIALFSNIGCQKAAEIEHSEIKPYSIQQSAVFDSTAVVSAHPLASEIGKNILRQGGNAIDATIAVHFALAVVCPRAGNIGGGGFMIVRTTEGETAALDYREKAPAAATTDMYLDSLGNVIPDISRKGHLSVGVPGTVDGMVKAHERFGKIKHFGDLVAPAVKLATEGYQISKTEADRLNEYQDEFRKFQTETSPFIKAEAWKSGDLLVQKDLGKTLQRIEKGGRNGFYAGETADLFIKEMEKGNGIITKEDLANYSSVWRDPIIGDYKDFRIISMPPPSSGGICLLQILEGVEDFPLAEYGFQTPKSIHLITEAERRAYADRAEHLGDSDFYPVPLEKLSNPDYIRERMSDYNAKLATPSDSILAGNINIAPESFETTHTSVIDADGNAVSVTTTLNLNYGSKVIVEGAGFLLNDEMDDFSAKPGVPNFFGLVGAEANKIEANKRMLSSMTPTIIEKEGKLFMVVGSPGGSTIITSVFQVFINVAEYGMNLPEAVAAKRFHHQWLPNTIMTEADINIDTMTLKEMGHIIDPKKRIGLVKAIHVLPEGGLSVSGDPRHADDDVAGW
jgi:gamma-glutamyltranspeptidase/glutathione hydrolase